MVAPFFVVVLVTALAAVAVSLTLWRGRAVDDGGPTSPRRRTRLAAVVVNLVGVLGGLIAAVLLAVSEPAWNGLGRGLLLAPLLFGVVLMAVIVAGSFVVNALAAAPPPSMPTPTRPGLPTLLPGTHLAAVGGLLVMLAGLVVVGWMTGVADERGRSGRVFSTGSPTGLSGSTSGPWPGEFYGLFAVLGIAALLAVLAAAIFLIWFRPVGARVDIDVLVRRREVESLVAATGVSLALLAFGLAGRMATTLLGVRPAARLDGYDPGIAYDLAGASALVVALLAVAVGAWFTVSLVVPAADTRTSLPPTTRPAHLQPA